MKKRLLILTCGMCMVAFAAGHAATQYELVQFVAQRNALMKELLSAYWPLLKIKNGESSGLAEAGKATRTIMVAIGRIDALFPPGTAKGEVPQTRARPEIWSEHEDFQAAINSLKEATASLQAAAEASDMAAFKSRFDAFTAACTGCHSFKPSGGGKFRYPR